MSWQERSYGLAWVGVGVGTVVVSLTDDDPLRRALVVSAVLAGALSATRRALARAAGRQEELDAAVSVARRDRAETRRHRDLLARQLARAERRLRDPVAEARRTRLAGLPGLGASLAIGSARHDVELCDLGPDHVVVALPAGVAAHVVPGLPAHLCVEVGGESLAPMRVFAVAPAPADVGAEWLLRFERALAPDELPAALRTAMGTLDARRVRPTRELPASATIVSQGAPIPARVEDLSEDGIALVVGVDDQQLFGLGGGLDVQLTLPTLGRFAVMSAHLRNVRAEGGEYRLGLLFADGQDHARGLIREWLDAHAAARDASVLAA